MGSIRRIVFTGDILRPFAAPGGGWESATHKNVRWLAHLIGWQLERATGLPQARVSWEPGGFDASRVYAALGLEVSADAWASIFYAGAGLLPDQAEALLAAPFTDALVVGVEIPDVLQGVLARRGIPFVDVVSHPVRFMDDLLFALRTSHPAVHEALLRHAFDLEGCVPYANLIRAKAAWMPALDLPRDTALVTGQVATDKALISRTRGRFVSLADYVEPLFALCARHERVLYKPHPYQGADCPSLAVIRSLRAIRIVDHNFYWLMGQDAIGDVIAISSGTLCEAPYFGKRSHGFLEPLYAFDDRAPQPGGAGACVPIGEAILSPGFWAGILASLVATRDQVPPGPAPRAARLRRSLNADWDHGFVDAIVQRDAHGSIAARAAAPSPPRARAVAEQAA